MIEKITSILVEILELSASVIILIASIRAIFLYFKSFFHKLNRVFPANHIRLSLGRSLALGLELLLGADIINTAIAPSWEEIGKLAAIAAIRTALNYFLEKELKNSEIE